jgi:hypothetical protein
VIDHFINVLKINAYVNLSPIFHKTERLDTIFLMCMSSTHSLSGRAERRTIIHLNKFKQ